MDDFTDSPSAPEAVPPAASRPAAWSSDVPAPPELGPKPVAPGAAARPSGARQVFERVVDWLEPTAGSRRGAVVTLAVAGALLLVAAVVLPIVLTSGNGYDMSNPYYRAGYNSARTLWQNDAPVSDCNMVSAQTVLQGQATWPEAQAETAGCRAFYAAQPYP